MNVGIRRNDYLASIRDDIAESDMVIRQYDALKRQGLELIMYCKNNHMHRFKRVAKLELKLLDEDYAYHVKRKKKLIKLLSKADKYAPGRETE